MTQKPIPPDGSTIEFPVSPFVTTVGLSSGMYLPSRSFSVSLFKSTTLKQSFRNFSFINE